ncbi:DUF6531 domain-containing protein [Actinocrinis sp.]|uniref:DUF6531 domain-containing protein n=1 Tax=Actinocrinis sp. TaxID=1920516 RepID=UPI002D49D2CC|nr:DUF6531 domain-containing protein [Actinocrinis sp.]HZP53624.1 DUF6531 domain-containing protein [Actinocrinis sp.]
MGAGEELAVAAKALARDFAESADRIADKAASFAEQTADKALSNGRDLESLDQDLGGKFDGIGKGGEPDSLAPRPGTASGEPTPGGEPLPAGGSTEPPTLNHGGETPTGGQAADGNSGSTTGGDPVDVVSGQMISSETDLELPGLLPLVLRRAYASGYRGGRHFGPGWSSTLDQRVEIDEDGIHFAGDDAQILHYPLPTQPGQQVLPAAGARWPLTWDRASDTIHIEDPGRGWTRHFTTLGAGRTSAGQLRPITAISDRNGHRITFVFDEDGVPSEVQHTGGYRVAVETDYTLAGVRVTALRLHDGSHDGQGSSVLTYGYDRQGRLTEVTDSTGVPYVYEFDDHDRVTAWTDRNSFRYEYEYCRETGRVVRGAGQDGYLSAAFEYDVKARATKVTNSLGHVTVFRYDEHGHITETVDPLGNVTRTEFDRYGRPLSRTDPLGHTTRFVRDERGEPVRIERPDGLAVAVEYNDLRLPVRVIGADGAEWKYEYDAAGGIVSVTDPAGAVIGLQRDERGALAAVIDALGAVSRYESDRAGLPLAATDPLGGQARIERDAFGRPVVLTDALGGTTRVGWTIEGRPAWRVLPDGTREEWTYDAEGNLLEQRAPGGAVTRFEYGDFSRPTARVDPSGARYRFAYDKELRPVSVTGPHGRSWTYEYDPAGRLVSETDFNGRTITYQYDAAGRVVGRTNGAGESVHLERDSLGAVTERRVGEAVTRFEYDAAGRISRALGPDSVLEYGRDSLGRVLTETVNGHVLASEYDAAGRRIRRTTPSGAVSEWAYDAAGRPISLATAGGGLTFQHDAAGREITRYFGTTAALSQEFDALGRLTVQGVWAYDRPEAEATATPVPRLLQQRSYTYRQDGIPTSVADALRGTRTFDLDRAGRVTAVNTATWTESYAYDQFGNIVQATGPWGDDLQGERHFEGTMLRRAGRVDYEHDEQGRVVRVSRRTLSGQTRQWSYTWDGEDRLTRVTTPDLTSWEYAYDPLGRRIAKRRLASDGAVAEETLFTWDDIRLAEQLSHGPDGRSTAVTWEWEPGTGRAATQVHRSWADDAPQEEIDAAFYAIVTDLVGTPSELIAADGRVAWHSTSTLWGSVVAVSADGIDCPLRFPGQYLDAESGLSHNVYRYYDSGTGRYVTPDPLGLAPAPNQHAYVPNPVIGTDELGLSPAAGAQTNYMDATDKFAINAANAKPMPGFHDVIIHGSPTDFGPQPTSWKNGTNFDHRTLANLLEHDPSYAGGPIRLLSCSTGKLPDGAAQNLANKLGVTVVAPTDTLWAYPSGRLTVGSTALRSSGSTDLWNVFEPGNSSTSLTQWLAKP